MPRSAWEWWKGHREYRATVAAAVSQIALMLAHDCLLYEEVPGSFAEPGREDQAQAGDQSSAQEHQRAFDTYADGGWDLCPTSAGSSTIAGTIGTARHAFTLSLGSRLGIACDSRHRRHPVLYAIPAPPAS